MMNVASNGFIVYFFQITLLNFGKNVNVENSVVKSKLLKEDPSVARRGDISLAKGDKRSLVNTDPLDQPLNKGVGAVTELVEVCAGDLTPLVKTNQ